MKSVGITTSKSVHRIIPMMDARLLHLLNLVISWQSGVKDRIRGKRYEEFHRTSKCSSNNRKVLENERAEW